MLVAIAWAAWDFVNDRSLKYFLFKNIFKKFKNI